MRIYWPDFYLESHRVEPKYGYDVAFHMTQTGDFAFRNGGEPDAWQFPPDLIFCGSLFKMGHAKKMLEQFPYAPLVNYSWDIYPWQLDPKQSNQGVRVWREYLEFLSRSKLILVPSSPQEDRHREFVPNCPPVKTIKCSVTPMNGVWTPGDHVLDIMRTHPDPNKGKVEAACRELGIPYAHTNNVAPREEFERLCLTARFLVSGYYEASTGGLSLLEAYACGVPVLLADSPRNGGKEYFGDRAHYFRWDDDKDLIDTLSNLRRHSETFRHDEGGLAERRQWVETEYSDAAFSRRLKEAFEEVLS